jgi:hypothetical protein
VTYEESVHLEAMQKASRLAYRPWVKAEIAALTAGVATWFVVNWLFLLTKLEGGLISVLAFIAVWVFVSRLEERFTIIYQQEFHKIYGGGDAPRP